MTVLRPILDVKELPPALSARRQHLPSLRDSISPEAGRHEKDVLSYLRQGVCCGVYGDPGLGRDVLNPARSIGKIEADRPDGASAGPQLAYTDGTWVWWGAILYYIETYHLRLPEEFLRHAEQRQWRVDASGIDLGNLDDSALDAAAPALAASRSASGRTRR
jgi:hypothetical protein